METSFPRLILIVSFHMVLPCPLVVSSLPTHLLPILHQHQHKAAPSASSRPVASVRLRRSSGVSVEFLVKVEKIFMINWESEAATHAVVIPAQLTHARGRM